MAALWLRLRDRTLPLATVTLLNVVEAAPLSVWVVVVVKLTVPVPAVNVPLFDQLPPTFNAGMPVLVIG